MQLIHGIEQLNSSHCPSVVSIGNYDGVHLGHQHVIETLLRKSVELQAASTVITFEPLAKEFFRPQSVVRLTSLEERAALLFELGVEQVLCINFTPEFAAYSPRAFVEQVLVTGLGTKYLCVGDDFRFGRDRAGDFHFLQQAGREHNFAVTAHDTFTLDQGRVSSGRVRQALLANDFILAERLLGRPYQITGVVSQGQQLGRTIDFPTANIALPKVRLPINGVYAVTAQFDQQTQTRPTVLNGVANVGTRPTVKGEENRLEVHLFDFDQDIYGQSMTVQFHHKIRDEQKFESFNELKQQIHRDAQQALGYFSNL